MHTWRVLDVVDLADLVDREPFHRGLAKLHATEWGHLYAPEVWNEEIAAAELAAMSTAPGPPRTLLAFDGPDRTFASLAGSVCLLATDDLDGWEHAGPWLASLWVMPHARGRGVGATLMARCVDLAAVLGHDDVHLFTAGQEAYYLERSWRTVANVSANGTPAAVMVRRTSATAARRSVVSTWTRDPDFGGAYSYLHPGGTPADRDLLGAQVAAGLWFAGEHTWSAAPGTMHGAWFSGRRAADAVVAAGHRSAIVVGAGLAGLAAAHDLSAAAVDVRVLEAGARCGGRAATDRTLGVPLHPGGAWLHGTQGHPLGALRSIAWSWARSSTYLTGSGMLPTEAHDRLSRAAGAIEQDLERSATGEDRAVGAVARPALAERSTGPVDTAVLEAWVRGSYENLYAAPIDELSLRYRAEPFRLPGDDRLLTSGIDAFVDPLAAGLDVRLGRRVATINQGTTSWQVVTESGERHAADAVIVTVPIVVLHRQLIGFDPPLADGVVAALQRIGCGPVAKVFATFDTAFWSPQRAFWVVDETRPPLELFVDVSALAGVPALCGFAVGEHAAAVEAMTEDARCRLVDRLLADAGVTPHDAAR